MHSEQDFDANHKEIEVLRLRNYTIGRKLKDEEVIGEKGIEYISGLIGAMVPFVSLF